MCVDTAQRRRCEYWSAMVILQSREHRRAIEERYRAKNREKIAMRRRELYLQNHGQILARVNKRRAVKRKEEKIMAGWNHDGVFKQKPCSICGKEFKPASGAALFCSKKCTSNHRKLVGNHTTEKQYERANKNPRIFFVKLIHGRGRGMAGSRSAISPEFLMEMFESQNGMCAISGLPMSTKLEVGGSWFRCSVDRKDNSNGYVPENVHLVCKSINIWRGAQALDDFIEMCKAVAKHQEKHHAGKIQCQPIQIPAPKRANPQSELKESGQGQGGETAW